jgi:hypothetical protein
MYAVSTTESLEYVPVRCLVRIPVLPEGRNIGVATRGQDGVRLTALHSTHGETAAQLVARLNRDFGVSAVQAHAMRVGAMRGWKCARSDPRLLPIICPDWNLT